MTFLRAMMGFFKSFFDEIFDVGILIPKGLDSRVKDILNMNVMTMKESKQISCSESLDSYEGVNSYVNPASSCLITSVPVLAEALNKIFIHYPGNNKWPQRREAILSILNSVELSEQEISRYAFFDDELPYTRNLAYSDGEYYSLLILCWTPGKESKIHDHPCDGCFVKVLKGQIHECRYTRIESPESKELVLFSDIHCSEGQVTFIDDYSGLHKIGNDSYKGSISLHLYTPPFERCKVWQSPEDSSAFIYGEAILYSEYGQKCATFSKIETGLSIYYI